MKQAGRNKVVILGGGVAGMSAAHELVERGYAVTVLEARDVAGGKARSIPATFDGLPGEHGFRFFPSFYQHLTHTMKSIPFGRNANGVRDNLVNTSRAAAARFGKDLVMMGTRFPQSPQDFLDLADDFFGNPFGLSDAEASFFGRRLMQIASSCDERRRRQYEEIPWWDFIEAERFSANYRTVLGSATRSLVAADPRKASARTIGDITLQAFMGVTTPGLVYDRVLNGPTSAAWIEPWLKQLRARGVEYRMSCPVRAIECDASGVSGVLVSRGKGQEVVRGDWYLAAVPVERMALLLNSAMLSLDPALANIRALSAHVDWMNGIQFYLKQKVPIVNGHVMYIDSPWALTSISQAQFWPDVKFSDFGDRQIRDCLSVDISNWEAPGVLYDKPARTCTFEEIAEEVWHQIRVSLNVGGVLRLSDEMLHSWFLDPAIHQHSGAQSELHNHDPLLINVAGSWKLRPRADTAIPNFFLASDYVQTNTDLACMESANEAARRAVNAIISASGLPDRTPCEIFSMPEPELFSRWRARDKIRFDQNLKWDASVMQSA